MTTLKYKKHVEEEFYLDERHQDNEQPIWRVANIILDYCLKRYIDDAYRETEYSKQAANEINKAFTKAENIMKVIQDENLFLDP